MGGASTQQRQHTWFFGHCQMTAGPNTVAQNIHCPLDRCGTIKITIANHVKTITGYADHELTCDLFRRTDTGLSI